MKKNHFCMEAKLIAEVLAVLWLALLRGILRSMN